MICEAEKDGDRQSLCRGGQRGQDVIRVFQTRAFLGSHRKEDEVKAKYGHQDHDRPRRPQRVSA